MKRGVSRVSRMSTDGQDPLEISIPGIPEGKWREFLEKEDTDSFILGVREEIVNNCLKICYDKYMEKQAVSFTVHCAYLAWIKVIDVYYMPRDPGDLEDPKIKATWEPDEEPEPSIIDSWASDCIKPMDPEPEKPKKKDRSTTEIFTNRTILELNSVETRSFISEFLNCGEEEIDYLDTSQVPSSIYSRRKSIFTRTLSMSKDSLPLVEPLGFFHGDSKENFPISKSPKKFCEQKWK